jgi:quercetin dioxygenase-like cupin family protein
MTATKHSYTPQAAGWHLKPGEGEGWWFLGSFMRFVATAESTSGRFALIDAVAGPGRTSPPHIHHLEDELFEILEGEVTFTCGESTHIAGPGSFVFLPRDVVHNYRVSSEIPARMLLWISPGGLDGFFKRMGVPGAIGAPPPSAPPDIEKLLALGREYHVEHPTLEPKPR